MKEIKLISMRVIPFMVTAILVYPFMAIVGGSPDPFQWAREDRIFYFLCSATFGWALMLNIMHVSGR